MNQLINWYPSPDSIRFGAKMVIADIAADKDHTVSVFTEQWVADNFSIKLFIVPKKKKE